MSLTIHTRSLTVSYTDEGPKDAPVIIFIHGFPFNKSMWKLQVDVLKDSYRVITYDIRGQGDTEEGNEKFSLERFGTDLVDLMDALRIRSAVLCGLSMGGYIALRVIEDHPERVDALILSDTQCVADTQEGKEKRMKTIENINTQGVGKYADESIKLLLSPESAATRNAEMVKEMIIGTSKQSLCNTILALAGRKETCSKLSRIKVPTLILVGKEDRITPIEAARMMHENIPDSKLHIIPHASHLPNIENPDEFNIQLKLFLDQYRNGVGYHMPGRTP